MYGTFKVGLLVFICSMLMCCKDKEYEEHIRLLNKARLFEKHLIQEGRQLILQNSNILIDSAFIFDSKRFDPKIKGEKLKIGLIDSINYKFSSTESDKYLVSFVLRKADLVNFKLDYELQLVERLNENTSENILFYTFSNLRVINNKAQIDVKKNYGISMMSATFFFEKRNNVWVFIKKTMHGDIG